MYNKYNNFVKKINSLLFSQYHTWNWEAISLPIYISGKGVHTIAVVWAGFIF